MAMSAPPGSTDPRLKEDELYGPSYRVSRYCPNGNCVEAGVTADGSVAVRDSKNPDNPPHLFSREEWVAFVWGVKDGDFDFFDTSICDDLVPRRPEVLDRRNFSGSQNAESEVLN